MKYDIYGTLKLIFNSPWGIKDNSIGTKLADIEIRQGNMIVIKDQKYIPILKYWIPGSSIKGTLRSIAIKLSSNECNHIDKLVENCLVCEIFGNSNKFGKVRVGSTFLDVGEKSPVTIQPHIMIDRKRGSIDPENSSLFFEENLCVREIDVPVEFYEISDVEWDFIKKCFELWGEFGLGHKHVPFKIENLDGLQINEIGGS